MNPHRTWPLLIALCASPGARAADGCDTLMAEIDAKIRANGQTRFALQTVDADAEAPGRVVGSCAMGRQKIVYLPQAGPGGGEAGGAPAPRARTPAPPGATMGNPAGMRRVRAGVLTECRPGYTGADCSERIAPPGPAASGPRP